MVPRNRGMGVNNPIRDDDRDKPTRGDSPRFQALLNHSRRSFKEGKGLSEEEFWKAVRERAQERKAKAGKGPQKKR